MVNENTGCFTPRRKRGLYLWPSYLRSESECWGLSFQDFGAVNRCLSIYKVHLTGGIFVLPSCVGKSFEVFESSGLRLNKFGHALHFG